MGGYIAKILSNVSPSVYYTVNRIHRKSGLFCASFMVHRLLSVQFRATLHYKGSLLQPVFTSDSDFKQVNLSLQNLHVNSNLVCVRVFY